MGEKTMSPASLETLVMSETASSCVGSRLFGYLRSVQWRIDLGILPSSPSASIDDLRRVTANSRRSYAALRKQLLVDPHLPKEGSNLPSPDLVMDNPLSQNPDSMWSRFFRNAELERMVDQDLTRLYPERGGYFQTSGCQVMLRRVLLLWCLKHPEYGYRQGMHELLAPLLYVLHVDVERLSEVRKAYEDHFADKFDGLSYHENDLTYKFDIKNGNEPQKSTTKATLATQLDPATQTIVLLSDAYGTEGELGIVLSEKFMEHDAYAMFDALMSGAGGAVAMAEFFSPSPYLNSHSGFSPVILASARIYNLLAIVDSSLHTHLVELGVEPQYFSLRWLRVLFGREFSLEYLLLIWDEIFARDNTRFVRSGDSDCGVLDSLRGALISSFAVSMILQLRSSLLASDNATACLQKLLNFPEDVELGKMVAKANSLQPLALDVNRSRDPLSPRTPLKPMPKSYWEEKWRVLQDEEENRRGSVGKLVSRWSERVRLLHLLRKGEKQEIPKRSVRKNLLDDLLKRLGPDGSEGNTRCSDIERQDLHEVNRDDATDGKCSYEACAGSEGNCSDFLDRVNGNGDREKALESSSVGSNSSIDENDVEFWGPQPGWSSLPVSDIPDGGYSTCDENEESEGTSRERSRSQSISGKFQWLWKFGNNGSEETSAVSEDDKGCKDGSNVGGVSRADEGSSSGTMIDQQNLIVSLRTLGQSMLENIQVIESVIQQQGWGETGTSENSNHGIIRNEQATTAVSALEELRKISNLLSEM